MIGAIRAEQATSATNQRAWRVAGLVAALAAAVLGIGAAVAFFVAGRLARPIRRLSDAAVQLGEGDFAVDLPAARSRRSMTPTARSTTTAHHLDELVSRERSFSADASTSSAPPSLGCGRRSRRSWSSPATTTRSCCGRCSATSTGWRRRSRSSSRWPAGPHSSGVTSPTEVLREVEREWHGRLAALGRPLIVDAEFLPLVQGPPAALRHAISILVDNAARHGRGAVRIGAEAGLETVTISVSDDGPGFPDAFEPGRRAPAEAGDGLHGVGLPLARRLVTSMPGRLVFVRLRPRPRIDIVVTALHRPRRPSRPCHRRRRSSARHRADPAGRRAVVRLRARRQYVRWAPYDLQEASCPSCRGSSRSISIVVGGIFIVLGAVTYYVVHCELADEHITVSDDARHNDGKDVKGPFTAYSQAMVIKTHVLEAGGGKTYAELPQDDPARATVMTVSFLRALLFTSVVSFGVAALVVALGVLFVLVGLALLGIMLSASTPARPSTPRHRRRPSPEHLDAGGAAARPGRGRDQPPGPSSSPVGSCPVIRPTLSGPSS